MTKTSKWKRFLYSINLLGLYPKLGKYDKDWDDKLNSLMEREKIVFINSFMVKFSSGEEVWISNHPYCSGFNVKTEEPKSHKDRKMPSLKTKWKFEELVLNYIKEKGLKIEMFY